MTVQHVFTSGRQGNTGATGAAAFTTTLGFTMPAQDGATTVNPIVGSSAWMAVGQFLFVPTAGWLKVTVLPDIGHVTLVNPVGIIQLAAPGTVIGAVAVSAAGAVGPVATAFTTVASPGFTMPTQDGATTVSVPLTSPPGSTWLAVGSTIFIATAGYLKITALPDGTHATVVNPTGYPGNVVSGTVIASGVGVQAAGIQGAGGTNGTNGATGVAGPTGAGPCGSVGFGPATGALAVAGDAVSLVVACATSDRDYFIEARCFARMTVQGGVFFLNDYWTQSAKFAVRNDAGVLTIDNSQFNAQMGSGQMTVSIQMAMQATISGTNVLISAIGNGNNSATPVNVKIVADVWSLT